MSGTENELIRLLTEVRDVQRDQFAYYKSVAERSLNAQDAAIDLQRRAALFYRRVVFAMTIPLLALIAYLYFLL